MRTERLRSSVRIASGPRVNFVDRKSDLNPLPSPPVVYTTDRSKSVAPMLLLICVALWLILRGD